MATRVNGYSISFSPIYERWQVKKSGICFEEFRRKDDAIRWANDN